MNNNAVPRLPIGNGASRHMLKIISLSILIHATNSAFAQSPRLSSVETRRAQLENNVIVIDVRPPGEFASGHIQGALNLPAPIPGSVVLPHNKELVIYCSENNCPLSESTVSQLISRGYKNSFVLDGGFDEWLRRHYPAQVGAAKHTQSINGAMPVEQAFRKIQSDKLLILDVRPSLEFSAGHLPKARSMPLEGLDATIGNLPKSQDVLVYDRRSERSRQAAQKLTNAGYIAFELAGGLAGWIQHGHTLEMK